MPPTPHVLIQVSLPKSPSCSGISWPSPSRLPIQQISPPSLTSTTWNDERFLNLFYFPFLIEYKLRGSTELSLSGISLYCRQLAQCLAGGRCLLNICGINSVPPPPTYHLLPLSPRSHHFLPLCLWPSMVTNHPSALPWNVIYCNLLFATFSRINQKLPCIHPSLCLKIGIVICKQVKTLFCQGTEKKFFETLMWCYC